MPVVELLCTFTEASYFFATLLVTACFTIPSRAVHVLWKVLATAAIAAQGLLLHYWINIDGLQNLTGFHQISLVFWLLCLFLLIGSSWRPQHPSPLEPLGFLCFPLAGASVVLSRAYAEHCTVDIGGNPQALLHILLSLLVLSVLCFAALQALFFVIQERFLQSRLDGIISRFPPLETVEQYLLRMLRCGFLLLSVLCISGLYSYMPGEISVYLLHKMLLVGLIWCGFAALLISCYWFGVGGRTIAYSTVLGVAMLLVIYMGSMLMKRFSV